MSNANTRKRNVNNDVTHHLLTRAHITLRKLTQTNVAKKLGIADSTVLRRSEKFTETFEILAAIGVTDFVLEGERVLDETEYRILITYAMNWLSLQKDSTESTGVDSVP